MARSLAPQIFLSEDLCKRIRVRGTKSGVGVLPPAFGEPEPLRLPPEGGGEVVHGLQIRIHALGLIQPLLLGGVTGEGGGFGVQDGGGIHEGPGMNPLAEYSQ